MGLGLASEGKMRKEASRLVGDNLAAEMVPFAFGHIAPANIDARPPIKKRKLSKNKAP